MTKRVFSFRLPILVALIVAEAIFLLTSPIGFAPPAQAQFFDGGFFRGAAVPPRAMGSAAPSPTPITRRRPRRRRSPTRRHR